jgi:hypothetical protein
MINIIGTSRFIHWAKALISPEPIQSHTMITIETDQLLVIRRPLVRPMWGRG